MSRQVSCWLMLYWVTSHVWHRPLCHIHPVPAPSTGLWVQVWALHLNARVESKLAVFCFCNFGQLTRFLQPTQGAAMSVWSINVDAALLLNSASMGWLDSSPSYVDSSAFRITLKTEHNVFQGPALCAPMLPVASQYDSSTAMMKLEKESLRDTRVINSHSSWVASALTVSQNSVNCN